MKVMNELGYIKNAREYISDNYGDDTISDSSNIDFIAKIMEDYHQSKFNNVALADVMRSNFKILWWGWTIVWGVIGIIFTCIKLWNYCA